MTVSTYAQKTDNSTMSLVNWQTSNLSDHEMIFGVYKGNGFQGTAYFANKGTQVFATNMSYSEFSYLKARRQLPFSPNAYVTGYWEP